MTEPVKEAPAEAAEIQPASGSPIRRVVRIILFGVLAYLVCALPYDYLIARKGEDQAWNTLQELLENNNMRKGRPDTTNEKVQEKLKRKPTTVSKTEHGDPLEVYSWRGGLPWKKYTIYVTYYESKDGLMLANAYRNESPDQVAKDVPHVDSGTETPTNPLTMPEGTPGPGGAAGGPSPGGAGLMGQGPPGFGPGGGRPGTGGPGGPGLPGGGRPTRPDAEEPAKKSDADGGSKTSEAEAKTPAKGAGEEKQPDKEVKQATE